MAVARPNRRDCRYRGDGIALWLVWSIAPTVAADTRVANEVALNGWAKLIRAYLTSHLDYEAYYSMVPAAEAELASLASSLNQTAPMD